VAGVWLGNDDGSPTKHVTGGSLPVEIWSRVMRAAHQGIPVAALPGTASGGGLFSSLFGSRAAARAASAEDAPLPPASVPGRATASNDRGGLDGWLLDNLFGRR
jgi:penicillin-binding protein 1A